MSDNRTDDECIGDNRPTDERWHELLEQLIEQVVDGGLRLRDEEWIKEHQVTDFERMMLFNATRKLRDLVKLVYEQTREPVERRALMTRVITDEANAQKLNLTSDQVADEVEQKERRRVMLTKMAEALRSGHDPFAESWLTEHGIAEPERSALHQRMGEILYGFEASHVYVKGAVNNAAKLYIDSSDTDSWRKREAIAHAALEELYDVLKISYERD